MSWKGGKGGFGARNRTSHLRPGELEIKLSICKEGHFKVESKYSEQLNNVYRALDGRFDKEVRAWCLHIDRYQELLVSCPLSYPAEPACVPPSSGGQLCSTAPPAQPLCNKL